MILTCITLYLFIHLHYNFSKTNSVICQKGLSFKSQREINPTRSEIAITLWEGIPDNPGESTHLTRSDLGNPDVNPPSTAFQVKGILQKWCNVLSTTWRTNFTHFLCRSVLLSTRNRESSSNVAFLWKNIDEKMLC